MSLYSLCISNKPIIWFLRSQEARRRLHVARGRYRYSNMMQHVKSGKEKSLKKSIKDSDSKAISNTAHGHLVGG